MSDSDRIGTSFDGQVAYVTLRHPPANVFDFPMITQMGKFLRDLRSEPRLCALVLQATGRTFSGGVDVASHLPDTVAQMIQEFDGLFELIDDLSVPTVALVRGPCLGGACELVGYQDVVIATPAARFGVPEIRLGVFPPVAASIFPQRFGYQGAMQLLLTGDIIDAAAAVRVGLASRLCEESDAALVLEETLQRFREKSASSLRIVKQATLRARPPFREQVRSAEEIYLGALMETADSVEGLRAFLEKRDPVWRHE